MRKNFVSIALVIMVIAFIIGLVLLFNSTNIGQNAGSRAIRANGGSMDGNSYNFIVDSTTENYRTGGMVIALVGGLGMLIGGYGFYKELEVK